MWCSACADAGDGVITAVPVGLSGVLGGQSFEKLMNKVLGAVGTDTGQVLGRSRGVLAMLVNKFSSGTIMMTVISGVTSIIGSRSAALAVIIVLSLLLAVLVWFYLFNVYTAVMARIFMEGRVYENVSVSRTLFFLLLSCCAARFIRCCGG